MNELANNYAPIILIAEDDIEQKNLLVDFAKNQVIRVLENENFTEEQRQKLNSAKILSVTNIESLKRVSEEQQNVILAILDCNIPDAKGGASHDQFVKTNYKITGQHHSVDIVLKNLPRTPITMISSLNRFQKIISAFYKKKLGLDINFISKNDPSIIRRNIRYYLRQYLS